MIIFKAKKRVAVHTPTYDPQNSFSHVKWILKLAEAQGHHAGIFSSWLRRTRLMLLGRTEANVPCGTCRGCCTSSKFIHIHANETASLLHIPKKLLFDAPMIPKGTKLLGYNEKGNCPMLIGGNCSIYHYRPIACREFDCRIFAAAGLLPDNREPEIVARVNLWEFSYPTKRDLEMHNAVKKAAHFIQNNHNLFPDKRIPTTSIDSAILAIKVYLVFVRFKHSLKKLNDLKTAQEIANAIVETSTRFELLRMEGN